MDFVRKKGIIATNLIMHVRMVLVMTGLTPIIGRFINRGR